MASWTLDWKRGPVEVSLPDANLQTVIRAPTLPNLGSPEELVTRALDNPIGCPPLEQQVTPGSRVAVLVSDMHDRLLEPATWSGRS